MTRSNRRMRRQLMRQIRKQRLDPAALRFGQRATMLIVFMSVLIGVGVASMAPLPPNTDTFVSDTTAGSIPTWSGEDVRDKAKVADRDKSGTTPGTKKHTPPQLPVDQVVAEALQGQAERGGFKISLQLQRRRCDVSALEKDFYVARGQKAAATAPWLISFRIVNSIATYRQSSSRRS